VPKRIRGCESFIIKPLTNLVIGAGYDSNRVFSSFQLIVIQTVTRLTTSLHRWNARCMSRRRVRLSLKGSMELGPSSLRPRRIPRLITGVFFGVFLRSSYNCLTMFNNKIQDLLLFFPYSFSIHKPEFQVSHVPVNSIRVKWMRGWIFYI